MYEWTEFLLNWYLERLAKNDTRYIAMTLFEIAELHNESQPLPTGNAKVIAYLEQLVEDHRTCVVDWRIPFVYGELRWLAARVLVCEYAYQGIEKSIILKDVVQPIREWYFVMSDERYRIGMTFDDLAKCGLLPTKTEIIKPQDYAYCCSKEAVEERKRNQNKQE